MTGLTVGKFSHINPVVKLNGKICSAWQVVSLSKKDFCESGDSGSFIIDFNGRWRGLLFASPYTERGDAFVVPIDTLIEDIDRRFYELFGAPWGATLDEPLQIVGQRVDQRVEEPCHEDSFTELEGHPHVFDGSIYNRFLAAQLYVQVADAGGETFFCSANLTVTSELGALVIWNTMDYRD